MTFAGTFSLADAPGILGNGTNEHGIIQAYLDSLPAFARLSVPGVDSHFGTAGPLVIRKPIVIEGNGCGTPNLTAIGGSVFRTSSQTEDVFRIEDVSAPVIIENIGIGSTVGNRTGAGVRFTASAADKVNSKSRLSVTITDQLVAVAGDAVSNLTLLDCTILATEVANSGAVGLRIRQPYNTDGGDNEVIGGRFTMRGGSGTAIQWQSGGGLSVGLAKILFGARGLEITSDGGVPVSTGQFAVTGTLFDGQSAAGVIASNANGADRVANIDIGNCVFFGSGSASFVQIGGSNQDVYDTTAINGCTMYVDGGGNAAAVQLYACKNVAVTGNVITKKNGGGSYGIRNQGAANFLQSGNVITGFATPVG